MNLYLTRHAIPETPGDESSGLSNEGGRQAQKLGRMFRRIGLEPTGLAVLASEKLRATQTAKMIYKSAFSTSAPLTTANPDLTGTNALLTLMRTYENASNLLVVWHFGVIGAVANFLLPATNPLEWPNDYGATAHIECDDNTLAANTGRLRWLILPELLP